MRSNHPHFDELNLLAFDIADVLPTYGYCDWCLSLSSLLGGETRRLSVESGEDPSRLSAAVILINITVIYSVMPDLLNLPKLWLSRFLIFFTLARVPPSFFPLRTTPCKESFYCLTIVQILISLFGSYHEKFVPLPLIVFSFILLLPFLETLHRLQV